MKYTAEHNGKEYEIEFSQNGVVVSATVDGRSYELDVSEPEAGVYLIKNGTKIREIVVGKNDDGTFHVRVGENLFDIGVADPKRLRGRSSAAGEQDGVAEIKTAMPGKIVRVLVAAGDVVEKGDGIIVVEAMKMQNELKSPKNGTVVEIRFAEGSTAAAGDVLVTIE
jgi:biotin carboxyl carrier protein